MKNNEKIINLKNFSCFMFKNFRNCNSYPESESLLAVYFFILKY